MPLPLSVGRVTEKKMLKLRGTHGYGGKPDVLATPAVRESLNFRLDDEEYGIDILKAQEIRGSEALTRTAHAPAVSDVMALPLESLRRAPEADGSIDLCARLGLGALSGRMLILLDIDKLISGPDMAPSSDNSRPPG